MISMIAAGIISMLEREIVKHEPEIQDYLLKELQAAGKLLIMRTEARMANKLESNNG